MKKYIKPIIEEELIELEDIITVSANETADGENGGLIHDASNWISNK